MAYIDKRKITGLIGSVAPLIAIQKTDPSLSKTSWPKVCARPCSAPGRGLSFFFFQKSGPFHKKGFCCILIVQMCFLQWTGPMEDVPDRSVNPMVHDSTSPFFLFESSQKSCSHQQSCIWTISWQYALWRHQPCSIVPKMLRGAICSNIHDSTCGTIHICILKHRFHNSGPQCKVVVLEHVP